MGHVVTNAHCVGAISCPQGQPAQVESDAGELLNEPCRNPAGYDNLMMTVTF